MPIDFTYKIELGKSDFGKTIDRRLIAEVIDLVCEFCSIAIFNFFVLENHNNGRLRLGKKLLTDL